MRWPYWGYQSARVNVSCFSNSYTKTLQQTEKCFGCWLMQQLMTLSVYHCVVVEEQRWWLTGECCNVLRFCRTERRRGCRIHAENSMTSPHCVWVKCFLWINVVHCCSATLKLENDDLRQTAWMLRQTGRVSWRSIKLYLGCTWIEKWCQSEIFKRRVEKYI